MKQKKRKDWLIFPIIILLSFLLMLFYIKLRKYYCEGNLSLPLDDPFIFFQYAKNMVEGHFLKYNIEDPPTTGTTSLLWQILLSFGFILRFYELKIIYWSLFLSLIILILSCIFSYLIGKRLVSHYVGTIASLIVMLNGPFLWAVFSGMDTGLFGMLIILSFFGFLIGYQTKNFLFFSISSSLMCLCRPEGFIIYLIVFFILLGNQIILPKNERPSFTQILFLFLPIICGFSWLFLNLLLTGSFSLNTMIAKSGLTRSDYSFWDNLASSIRYFFFFLKEIFTGFSGEYINILNANTPYVACYIAPFALFFFIFAVFPRIIHEMSLKKLGPYSFSFIWFFSGVFIASITIPGANVHWHRYIIPYYPLFLIITVIGIYHLSQVFPTYKNETFLGISIFFILFSF